MFGEHTYYLHNSIFPRFARLFISTSLNTDIGFCYGRDTAHIWLGSIERWCGDTFNGVSVPPSFLLVGAEHGTTVPSVENHREVSKFLNKQLAICDQGYGHRNGFEILHCNTHV